MNSNDNRLFLIAILLSLFFTLGCSSKSPSGFDPSRNVGSEPVGDAVTITIDNSIKHQTMEGFGATNISLVYEGKGDVLGVDLRARAVELIYNQVGINMGNLEGSLLESPGSYVDRSNDNDMPSIFNWDGFQANASDRIKTKLVDLAEPYGFDNFYLGQKINVRWASPWLGDIRGSDYERYLDEAAEQVAAGQIYWRDTYNIIPNYLMLYNEPLSGNRELKNGTVRDVVDIIKRAGARLRSEGFSDIKFIVPGEETVAKSLGTITAVLNDPEARQYVGAIAYHSYPYGSVYASIPRILGSSGAGNPDLEEVAIRNQIRNVGKQYGIPVWMTEVSHGEVDPRSFDDFRGRAIHIHDELIYADAAAYFGMNNMWDSVSHQMHFRNNDLFSESGTIILIDSDSDTIYVTGIGYAIGHYARWIKKGAIRIEAASSDRLVQVTAFRDDAQGRMVLVLINNASSERKIDVEIAGLELGENLTGELSTAKAYWEPLTPFFPTNENNFIFTVPAKSVTTVTGQVVSYEDAR